MDKMIRELIVDVTQKGSARTAKSLEGVATAIDGITENSAKAKKALSEISNEIMQLEAKVKNTTSAMANLGSTNNFFAFNKQIENLNRNLAQLESVSQVVSGDLVAGMGKASAAAKELSTSLRGVSASKAAFTSMSNSIGTAAASMSNLNKTLGFINNSLSTFSSFSSNSTKNLTNLTGAIANLTIQYGKLSSAISVAKFQLNDMAKAGDTSGLKDLSSTLNGINLTQRGAGTTAKSIAAIVTALQDAAAGAELAKAALKEVSAELVEVEAKASSASSAMRGLGKGANLGSIERQLSTVEDYLDELLTTMTVMSEKMTAGFAEVSNAVNKMGNNVASSVEKAEDSLIGMEANVRRTATAMGAGSKAANDYSRALGNTSGSSRGATRDFAALKDAGGSLTKGYAILAANIFVVKEAFDQVMQGDQLNRLEQFGEVIGSINGTPVQSLAVALQKAAGGAVSFQEAMKQASVASTYGFNADQLEQFGVVARRASAVLGIDMADALDRVIKGVSKQEIELLDELGVTIKLNDAYAAYAAQLNATSTGMKYNIQNLTTYQKQQAYANAVIQQSTQRLGYLDDMLRADAWETFAANANAALRSVQQSFAKYLTPMISSINALWSTTGAGESTKAARAQQATNSMVDPSNTSSVINTLEASQKGYQKAVEDRDKANNELLQGQAEFNRGYSKLTSEQKQLFQDGKNGFYTSDPMVASLVEKSNKLQMLNREVQDSGDNIKAWGKAVEVAAGNASKNDITKGLITGKAPSDLSFVNQLAGQGSGIDTVKLGSLSEKNKQLEQTAKTAKDIVSSTQTLASNWSKAGSITSQYRATIDSIRSIAGDNVDKQNEMVKNTNLGFNTLKEMENAYGIIDKASKSILSDEQAKNNVLNKEADVYAQTKDRQKAEAAGRALEMSQLQTKIDATKQLLSLDPDNADAKKQLLTLENERLSVQNQGMENAKKVRDTSRRDLKVEATTLDMQKQINLLNDNTSDEYDYQQKALDLQLSTLAKQLVLYKTRSDMEKEVYQTMVRQAELERQKRESTNNRLNTLSKQDIDQRAALRDAGGNISDRDALVNKAGDLTAEKQSILANALKAGVAVSKDSVTSLDNQIAVLNKSIDTLNRARDMAKENNVISSLGGSYNAVDQNASQDMKDQNNVANQFNDYDSAISNLKSLNSEATTTAQSLGNLSMAMYEYSKGSINATTMASQGMQTVAQLVSFASNQQQNAIDAQIAAEQNRDGKSEESKAKIKKLEAEKLKIQQANAKKQIIISTAVAMMNAAATAPFLPLGLAMMATAAAAGALSLASASSASSIPTADTGSTTATSLSLGNRTNSIDVSQSANGGELSYIRGDRGIGTSQSFTPRAAGGDMVPGVSYLTGEKGIEVITPKVPSKATSASDLNSQSQSSQAPIIFQIHAMDASSFKDFAEKHSDVFRGTVEQSLNNNGLSLKNLESR